MVATVRVIVAGVEVDDCDVALPIEITHGRSDVTVQPDPPSAKFTIIGPAQPGELGASVVIDSAVDVPLATYDDPVATYDDPGAVYDSVGGLVWATRFVGDLVAMTATELEGAVQTWDCDAVGTQARLGVNVVGGAAGPYAASAQTDAARVQTVFGLVGAPPCVFHGADTVNLVAADLEGDALSLLQEVCVSSGGLLWQSPDGAMNYGSGSHRAQFGDPLGVIPCEQLEDGVTWSTKVEDVINSVTVAYGSPEARATFTDAGSVSMPWGKREVEVTTGLAAAADANVLGALVLVRRAWPYWGPQIGVVDIDSLDVADRLFMRRVDVSSAVLVPITMAPYSTPADLTDATVEGWVESWTADGHFAQVALSDRSRWVHTRSRTYTEALAGTYQYWRDLGSYIDLLVTTEA